MSLRMGKLVPERSKGKTTMTGLRRKYGQSHVPRSSGHRPLVKGNYAILLFMATHLHLYRTSHKVLYEMHPISSSSPSCEVENIMLI